jgi:D-glycero-D-manno-heptose 1,7-bisphosphate phosphatase
MFAEAAVLEIHEKIQAELGETIDAFYFCPHLPTDGCACRKPKLGMIEAACANFEIDLENSWLIGDKAIDVETGWRAGIKTAMVLTGYGQKELEKLTERPDVIAENLLKAVKLIAKK